MSDVEVNGVLFKSNDIEMKALIAAPCLVRGVIPVSCVFIRDRSFCLPAVSIRVLLQDHIRYRLNIKCCSYVVTLLSAVSCMTRSVWYLLR